MILITGGLGFVGSHTARALVDLGEPCVLVQRREPVLADDLAGEVGRRVFAERADITDLAALLDIGARHKITGIVHMAGSVPWPPGADQPVPGARKAIGSLLNVLQAACDWQVPRVGVASTIGVYGGATAERPLREDTPLPMTAGHVIPAFKKIGELLGDYLADVTGIEIINYRLSPWGPGGNPASPFSAAPQLVHAATRGTVPDFSALRSPAYAGDGFDMCYIRDCGRAIALLQLAQQLSYRTYNIASGRVLDSTGRSRPAVKPSSLNSTSRFPVPEPGLPRPGGMPGHQQAPGGHQLPARYDTDAPWPLHHLAAQRSRALISAP